MTSHRLHRRGARAALPAAVACALLAPDGGQAQVVGRFSAFASLGGGYSANPFLVDGEDTGSGYLELTLAPSYLLLEPTASTRLSAVYSRSEYYRRYSNSESYRAFLTHNRRLDARTSIDVNIGFDSAIQGERRSLFAPPVIGLPPGEIPIPEPGQPTGPGTVPGPVLPIDPTLIGRGLRRSLLNANATVTTTPSPFDTYALSVRANRTFSTATGAADYRSYGETLSYSRRLSESINVGARVSVDRTEYLDPGFPDAVAVQPQLTYGQRISSSLTVDAAVGAILIDSDGDEDRRSISGSLTLCHVDPRSRLCFTGDRSAGASGAGGVSEQLNASLNYSYQLTPYDNVSAAITYSKSDELADFGLDAEYLYTSLAWNTQATRRLSGGVNLSFRRSFESLRSASADVNGQVYLRLSFGQ